MRIRKVVVSLFQEGEIIEWNGGFGLLVVVWTERFRREKELRSGNEDICEKREMQLL